MTLAKRLAKARIDISLFTKRATTNTEKGRRTKILRDIDFCLDWAQHSNPWNDFQ